ncbi:MAG: hypothetical protein BWK76_28535 [Desulfobulbaceae bacterium A2]|nr:MAG: hypothetical protein BWK76_28535 [Desulfobulbaceae bacterium A2]
MRGLIDSTLREGGQTVGVSFTLAQKVEIVRLLACLGIEEIELGVATARDEELPALFRHARGLAVGCRLALWCRLHAEDIRLAATLGPDVLSLSVPVSDRHMTKKLGLDRTQVLARLEEAVTQARSLGLSLVSLGLEDCTRADQDFLVQVVQLAARLGIARLRLADTVGRSDPRCFAKLVRKLRKCWLGEIAVHAHNDFGLATASALACLDAGADWADVAVLGLGERAGLARLEELVGFLVLGRDRDRKRYRVEWLPLLCETVAIASGRGLAPHHPVVGQRVFACETGLHLAGLLRAPETYEPFDPARIGSSRLLLFGEKTGRRAVQLQLAALGLHPSPEVLTELVAEVREQSRCLRRPLSVEELRQLAQANILVS